MLKAFLRFRLLIVGKSTGREQDFTGSLLDLGKSG
jgi:hypothetical protein